MIHTLSVFEIKGAPCTLCAYFGCRVHIFQHLCTRCVHAFSNISLPSYKEEHMDILPGAQFWLPMQSPYSMIPGFPVGGVTDS